MAEVEQKDKAPADQRRQTHFELIVAGTRRHLGADDKQFLRERVSEGLNWGNVLSEAINHGVDALFLETIVAECADLLADDTKQQIAAYQKNFKFRNAFLIEELDRIATSLHEAGIPAIALKGPVLAKHAYGDVNRRRYGDIDLFIPRDKLTSLSDVLAEHKYAPYPMIQEFGAWKRKLWLFMYGQVPFTRGNGLFNVDVHTKLMPLGYPLPTDFAPYWGRAEPTDIGTSNTPVYRFAPEDLLLILCYHGLKNQWKALKYICDVVQLIEQEDSLDWTAVWRRARTGRSKRASCSVWS